VQRYTIVLRPTEAANVEAHTSFIAADIMSVTVGAGKPVQHICASLTPSRA
jgi:hypothetical protein